MCLCQDVRAEIMRWLAVLHHLLDLPWELPPGLTLMESHLTELEHLAENGAVFPYIEHLHLLHHLVLQKCTEQGVTTLSYAQGYIYDGADKAAASASTTPYYQG